MLTIDPARRLAQSLGLTELDNVPRPVAGVGEEAGGSLHAMMLDMKRTFDEVVEAHSTPEKAAQILENPFYQSVSSSFAGTQEYMAMEKLGQLRAEAAREGTWDLIVVDTPPSRSALDFLDAPKRLGSFLDGRFIRLLTAPARAGGKAYLKVFSVGATIAGATLSKVLGGQFLADVQTFVAALETMFGGFRERADVTYALLKEPTTPSSSSRLPSATPCARRPTSSTGSRARGCRSPGVVVNRLQVLAAPALSGSRAAAAAEQLEDRGAAAASRGRARGIRPARRADGGPPAAARRPRRRRGPARGPRAPVRRRALRGQGVDGAGRRHGHPRPRGAAHRRVRARRRLRPGSGSRT